MQYGIESSRVPGDCGELDGDQILPLCWNQVVATKYFFKNYEEDVLNSLIMYVGVFIGQEIRQKHSKERIKGTELGDDAQRLHVFIQRERLVRAVITTAAANHCCEITFLQRNVMASHVFVNLKGVGDIIRRLYLSDRCSTLQRR